MSVSPDHLYDLLPALYRERDSASGGALKQYLRLLTDELAVVADGIDQLYDDLFVETAAPWVLPYLADLIGLQGLPGEKTTGSTPRAEVANTIAYRMRKGTAAVLEQVARDTTGWPARAVEFFELLATTQHINHVRPGNHCTVAVRGAARLEQLGTAFERGRTARDADFVHLPEMRRIATGRGRYNLPNVGLFLWRLKAYPVTRGTLRPLAPGEEHLFLLDPLGAPVQLFTSPVTETEVSHLADPLNVPAPLTRRLMDADLGSYYGRGLSVHLPDAALSDVVEVCDLRDVPGTSPWAHTPVPTGRVRIDPVLGRVAFGDARESPPVATYFRGFSADLGGGEYDRVDSFAPVADRPLVSVAAGGADHTSVAGALAALPPKGGVVEIRDNRRYAEAFAVTADSGTVELRAADGFRPTLSLPDDLDVTVTGGGTVALNGLLVAGGAVRVSGDGRLALRHCTLVPGIDVDGAGDPVRPGTPSLWVSTPETSAVVERSILGGVRGHLDAEVSFADCVIDAGESGIAYASTDEQPAATGGAAVTFDACTILGRVHARILDRLSNSIVLARVPATDAAHWSSPVLTDRRQRGCVRFSSLPPGSRTPRRHRCVPEDERLRPVLASARYGDPTYCRLDRHTPEAVWCGADDEAELGVFHHLRQPRREAYLRMRLDDYLRFGLEANLIDAT
ncbi:hypothetical protein AB0Q95_05295 [Streptomyces sp. NPDC059900]|uniref:hypothetical protein n=1 Tax=Streptomyces sp. NPDC059900 TaxID=3155816 RepID=UPI00343C5B00